MTPVLFSCCTIKLTLCSIISALWKLLRTEVVCQDCVPWLAGCHSRHPSQRCYCRIYSQWEIPCDGASLPRCEDNFLLGLFPTQRLACPMGTISPPYVSVMQRNEKAPPPSEDMYLITFIKSPSSYMTREKSQMYKLWRYSRHKNNTGKPVNKIGSVKSNITSNSLWNTWRAKQSKYLFFS